MRILAVAFTASMLLAVAGPHARAAIDSLHNEFAALNALSVTAVAEAPQAQRQPPHWVAVDDYTAALAREQARSSAR